MKARAYLFILTLVLFTTACVEENTNYNVPETYNFDNVDYSGQTDRLGMLTEIKEYAQTTLSGNALDAGKLHGMYANDSQLADWTNSYNSSKQLRNKTNITSQIIFDGLLTALANDSQTPAIASSGTAGIGTSLAGDKSYYLNAKGLEYAQAIEKGLMGACIYYQATGVYLEDEKMNQDNNTSTPGRGTEMEHAWDEAFGYLGVPTNFPSNTEGLLFWGKYTNSRDAVLDCNTKLMDAFLAGRAAISHGDLDARDSAIEDIRRNWELVSVGSALHYLNSAVSNYNDTAIRCHALSEAAAFIFALQFNPDRIISYSEMQGLLEILGGSAAFLEMNFYNSSLEDIQNTRSQLASIYGQANNVALF